MTIEEIKELIQVVNESGIAELEVARGDSRVRIRRTSKPPSYEVALAPSPTAIVAAPSPTPSVPVSLSLTQSAPVPTPGDTMVYIKSPIVGTFYDSPTPGNPPFVKVGDRVTSGQVLCIIESMKLMNEIESEVTGTIVARLIENAKPVEYGESLFAIQPA
ncbi:MAG: acetyl-CoA carboxylase biotin carboxyl carrier protein [Bryobacteraceae bacterium]|nr:acetyl-CoA carboxylase biotin carboxyl carrier protein [Bryobacteraceae bacterium]